MTTTTAQLPQVTPDRSEHMTRRDFVARLFDDGSPAAEFQSVGYALGVYLTETCDSYVVAPSHIGGPPRAMAEADTYWFDADSPLTVSDAYARACLWALQQVVKDLQAEEQ